MYNIVSFQPSALLRQSGADVVTHGHNCSLRIHSRGIWENRCVNNVKIVNALHTEVGSFNYTAEGCRPKVVIRRDDHIAEVLHITLPRRSFWRQAWQYDGLRVCV